MAKVKIKHTKTGVVKEVSKAIASDFIGTKEWEFVVETKGLDKDIKKDKKSENSVFTENEE